MSAGFSVLPRARRISYQFEELEAAGGNLPHEPNNNIVYKSTAAETRPTMASPIPLTQEEERLIQLYTNYFVQVEQISVKVRHLSNNKDLYNAAVAKWKNESPRIPPADDEKKRAEYFNQCNKICNKEPKDPEECVLTSGLYLYW
jgi:hypothetical protein